MHGFPLGHSSFSQCRAQPIKPELFRCELSLDGNLIPVVNIPMDVILLSRYFFNFEMDDNSSTGEVFSIWVPVLGFYCCDKAL